MDICFLSLFCCLISVIHFINKILIRFRMREKVGAIIEVSTMQQWLSFILLVSIHCPLKAMMFGITFVCCTCFFFVWNHQKFSLDIRDLVTSLCMSHTWCMLWLVWHIVNGVVAMLRRGCVFQCEEGFPWFRLPKEKTRNPWLTLISTSVIQHYCPNLFSVDGQLTNQSRLVFSEGGGARRGWADSCCGGRYWKDHCAFSKSVNI